MNDGNENEGYQDRANQIYQEHLRYKEQQLYAAYPAPPEVPSPYNREHSPFIAISPIPPHPSFMGATGAGGGPGYILLSSPSLTPTPPPNAYLPSALCATPPFPSMIGGPSALPLHQQQHNLHKNYQQRRNHYPQNIPNYTQPYKSISPPSMFPTIADPNGPHNYHQVTGLNTAFIPVLQNGMFTMIPASSLLFSSPGGTIAPGDYGLPLGNIEVQRAEPMPPVMEKSDFPNYNSDGVGPVGTSVDHYEANSGGTQAAFINQPSSFAHSFPYYPSPKNTISADVGIGGINKTLTYNKYNAIPENRMDNNNINNLGRQDNLPIYYNVCPGPPHDYLSLYGGQQQQAIRIGSNAKDYYRPNYNYQYNKRYYTTATTPVCPNRHAKYYPPPTGENKWIPPGEELQQLIAERIESMFQDEYLFNDTFMLKHVLRNKDGYVNLKLLSALRKIKRLTQDWRDVMYSILKRSKFLVLNGPENTKVRRAVMPQLMDVKFNNSRLIMCYNIPLNEPIEILVRDVLLAAKERPAGNCEIHSSYAYASSKPLTKSTVTTTTGIGEKLVGLSSHPLTAAVSGLSPQYANNINNNNMTSLLWHKVFKAGSNIPNDTFNFLHQFHCENIPNFMIVEFATIIDADRAVTVLSLKYNNGTYSLQQPPPIPLFAAPGKFEDQQIKYVDDDDVTIRFFTIPQILAHNLRAEIGFSTTTTSTSFRKSGAAAPQHILSEPAATYSSIASMDKSMIIHLTAAAAAAAAAQTSFSKPLTYSSTSSRKMTNDSGYLNMTSSELESCHTGSYDSNKSSSSTSGAAFCSNLQLPHSETSSYPYLATVITTNPFYGRWKASQTSAAAPGMRKRASLPQEISNCTSSKPPFYAPGIARLCHHDQTDHQSTTTHEFENFFRQRANTVNVASLLKSFKRNQEAASRTKMNSEEILSSCILQKNHFPTWIGADTNTLMMKQVKSVLDPNNCNYIDNNNNNTKTSYPSTKYQHQPLLLNEGENIPSINNANNVPIQYKSNNKTCENSLGRLGFQRNSDPTHDRLKLPARKREIDSLVDLNIIENLNNYLNKLHVSSNPHLMAAPVTNCVSTTTELTQGDCNNVNINNHRPLIGSITSTRGDDLISSNLITELFLRANAAATSTNVPCSGHRGDNFRGFVNSANSFRSSSPELRSRNDNNEIASTRAFSGQHFYSNEDDEILNLYKNVFK